MEFFMIILIGILIIMVFVGLLRWVLGTSRIIYLLEQILQETKDRGSCSKRDSDP